MLHVVKDKEKLRNVERKNSLKKSFLLKNLNIQLNFKILKVSIIFLMEKYNS